MDGVWEFPLAQCPRHPSSVFDTYHAFRSGSYLFRIRRTDEDCFFDAFVHLVELGIEHGAYVNSYFDPMDVRCFHDFARFLDYLMWERQVIVAPYRALVEILTRQC